MSVLMSQFWSLSYNHVIINTKKLAEGSVDVQHHGSLKLFRNSVLKKQKQTLKNDLCYYLKTHKEKDLLHSQTFKRHALHYNKFTGLLWLVEVHWWF